ncbi:MAG: pyrroloquinoline quinone-dependent dehydrogenase [Chitinophagaceae bacterium]
MKSPILVIVILSITFFGCKNETSISDHSDWPAYAGNKDGNRYSTVDQINPENVSTLAVAWTFSSADKDTGNRSQIQCNPIMVDGILYGVSPWSKLLALDAATGNMKWQFHPSMIDAEGINNPSSFYKVMRGVMYWQSEDGKQKRIFYSPGSKIYAINALDGKPIKSFGGRGYIDLTENVDREPGTYNPYIAGTTPGVIYKNSLIISGRVLETADAAPGDIRAFDVITGALKWTFHTIPHPGEKGYETWPDKDAWKKLGGANSWAGMSVDEKRGIVYVPTGTVSGDFYGGFRKGENLFGNSLIALDAETGKYIWHYQVVHHDIWDRDLAANPNLVTIKINGKTIDAVAQTTKHGYIFVFDRDTGKPVFPINEIPVPKSDLPGEEPWPTQPIPELPETFSRQEFTASDVSDRTPEVHADLMQKFNKVKYGTKFTPPSKEGVWIFPGFDGGGEWGGAAVDKETGIMYVNSSELPWSLTMVDVPSKNLSLHSLKSTGQSVYIKNCSSCHGPELKGNGSSYPALLNLENKFSENSLGDFIANGRNMMPAFNQIKGTEKDALLAYLLKKEEKEPTGTPVKKEVTNPGAPVVKNILDEVPYDFTGYNRFLDNDGYPGIKPPWGTLNAVNLNSGKLLWKVPLGEYDELTKLGIPVTGSENYGGPLVTKGGLVFIASTKDEKIRAFDKKTGKVLWEHKLPAAGFATPATYSVNGRQYVVIACGGGKIGNKSGDTYVAFALPTE